MGKNKIILLAVFIFSAALSIAPLFSKPVEAAMGIKIVPSLVDELVAPGEVIKRTIKVTNISDFPATMYAMVMDFRPTGEEGRVELLEPNSEEGSYMSSWIEISAEPMEFAAGEEKSISYTVVVPENAGPGGHYGAISFGTRGEKARPGDAEKGAEISISQQAVSLLLFQVAGDIVEKAIVKEFTTDKNIYSTPFEVKFKTRVENLGNTHIAPRGAIELKNMFGKNIIFPAVVNEKGSYVMPSGVRLFDNVWKSEMGFGKYEADLILSYGTGVNSGGEGKKSLSMKTYFWILPMKIIAFSVGAIAIIFGAFAWFLASYKKKAVDRAMKQMGAGEKYSLKKSQSPVKYYLSTFLAILAIVLAVLSIVYFLFI